MEKRYGAGLWAFGTGADRYNPSGLREPLTTEEKITRASQAKNLAGLELKYPTDFENLGVESVRDLLKKHGLKLSAINVNLSGDPRWRRGSITNIDEQLRRQAIERAQEAMDVAEDLGSNSLILWLGQDGHDYLFNDYQKAWELLLNGVFEIATHNDKVTAFLEYKHKEPRTHLMISNVAKALLVVGKLGLKNAGVVMDVGHAFMVDENAAESIALVNMNKTPLYIHFNDCYGYWDDDMIPGSVNFWKYIEIFYQLKKVGYEGWYDLDIYPYREDPVKSIEQGISFIDYMRRRIDENYPEIEKIIKEADVHEKVERTRKIFLKEY